MKEIKRIGIIAEYNPFHNGHILQINWVKEKFPKAKVVVVLSGNYVQRGEIAIAPYERRKQICMDHGVDEVHELDFWHATQAAHVFAQGAVAKMNELKVDAIVFGSESNNVEDFYLVAQAIYKDENKFYELVRKEMKQGISFPKANELACKELIDKSFVLSNDILGLEYVKAIVKNKYDIKAFCIKRNVGFHSDETIGNIASATHIRKLIYANNQSYKQFTPMVFDQIPDRIENHFNEFKNIVNSLTKEELKEIHLIDEGMENLFKKHINKVDTYDEFVNVCNSRRYTSSRIKRAMLYVLKKIPKNSNKF